MGFFSPWFLAGFLAVGLPIYIHLLQQHKTTPLPFSSLMFFERRTQSSVKHRRLKYLLLFAMRVALLILLALAFANLYVSCARPAGATGKKLSIVAIDNSFSMRAGDRFEQARRGALGVLAALRPGDTAQIIAFDSRVQILTQPIEDAGALRSAVQSLQPGDGRSSYGELSRALRSLAQASRIPVEAHVFTDIQRTSLPVPFSELAVASNTRLVAHPVARRTEPNWFVETVNAPPAIYQPNRVRIQATVAGAGTEAATLRASLALNGNVVESREVAVAAGGRATAEFFLNEAPYGLNRGEVRIESRDRLPADDRFPFSIERKEASRILFVHEARNSRAVLYYRAAIEASPDSGFSVESVTADQAANLDPKKFAIVVLSDVAALPGALEASLNSYVNQGGSVLISLGPAAATRSRVRVFEEALAGTSYAARSGDRFQTAASVDASHPALELVNHFEGVKFFQAVRVTPGKARILARLTDDTPLVLEKKAGDGRILVFASTFDNVSNDLPLHASFVPFVQRSAQYLSGFDSTPGHFPVGSHADLRSAREAATAVEVVAPGGGRALSLREAATARSFELAREGFYEVRRGSNRNELLAVHADRRESNLDVVPQETLALWQNAGDGPQGAGGPAEPGERRVGLWWYFALALLAMAIVESVVASRYLSVEREAGAAAAGRRAA
ncbi:MAG: BatA domain-containing protein [Acidobacteria bacterium]|nr:BatA domain-containing protein [Acidobacteriota bacterium]